MIPAHCPIAGGFARLSDLLSCYPTHIGFRQNCERFLAAEGLKMRKAASFNICSTEGGSLLPPPTMLRHSRKTARDVLQLPSSVLVDFWAEWCGPCKMLAPSLEEIAADQRDRAIIAKVNIDEHPALAERYSIQSIPTLLYFSGGELRDRTVGVVSKKEITNRLAALAQTTNN